MAVAKGVVLDFHLILEEAQQLAVGLWREVGKAILGAQLHFTDVAQLLIAWCGYSECVFETILRGRVRCQEIVQALGQTSNDNDGIFVPFVHLDKQFIQRIDLVGVAVGQQLLDIVEEENAPLGVFHILVPLVDKALIVDSIDHRQLGLLYDFMLLEIVSNNL